MREPNRILWPESTPVPTLRQGALHLWRIPCGGDGANLDDLWPHLSLRERDKADRLHQERHRQRYARAHAGLRHILSIYLGTTPRAIEFTYGPMGKPAVQGDLEFNLTTSADLALVAVRLDRTVGIDCERLRPRSNLVAIARRMFDTKTTRRVEMAPEAQRLQVFSQAWTALEASVKADGRGLFHSRDMPPIPSHDVTHFIPEAGHMAAIASQDLPPPTEWTALSLIREP